jgi:hypothetical protein
LRVVSDCCLNMFLKCIWVYIDQKSTVGEINIIGNKVEAEAKSAQGLNEFMNVDDAELAKLFEQLANDFKVKIPPYGKKTKPKSLKIKKPVAKLEHPMQTQSDSQLSDFSIQKKPPATPSAIPDDKPSAKPVD